MYTNRNHTARGAGSRIFLVALAVWAGLASPARAAEDRPQTTATVTLTNTMCPVMPEEKSDPNIWVDREGTRVYLCCPMCRKDFLKNPAPYLANLAAFASSSPTPDVSKEKGEGEDGQNDGTNLNEIANPPEIDLFAGADSSGPGRLVGFVGKFHPLIVHFPIALILAAALAEALFLVLGFSLFRNAARFCIVLGALSAVPAAGLGWAAAAQYVEAPRALTIHRWLGVAASVLAVLTAILSELSFRMEKSRLRKVYFAGLILSVVLVGLTGHFGATLIYGPDYFTW